MNWLPGEEDLLLEILSFCPVHTLLVTSSTCLQWLAASRSDRLWQALYQTEYSWFHSGKHAAGSWFRRYSRLHDASWALGCVGGAKLGETGFVALPEAKTLELNASAAQPPTEFWTPLPQLPNCRHALGVAVDHDKGLAYAIGGLGPDQLALSSVDAVQLGSDSWHQVPSMTMPRCYSAASIIDGALVVSGGSDSIWRDGATLSSIETYLEGSWRIIAEYELQLRRCGHCMVPLPSGPTVVLGGFDSVGITYHNSAELLGSSVTLPVMSSPRTGFAACAGPDGAIYVAGGSSNGEHMLSSCERLDMRTNSWEPLSSMARRHGYCAGACAPDGSFLVGCGVGQGMDPDMFGIVEVFDTRMLKWREWPAPVSDCEELHSPGMFVFAQHQRSVDCMQCALD